MKYLFSFGIMKVLSSFIYNVGEDMRSVDISTISNTILIILWVILPKLYRIWKKKNIFYVYDIPFDLMPIFILSNGWMRFGIWLVIYAVFMFILIFLKGKVLLSSNKQSSQKMI